MSFSRFSTVTSYGRYMPDPRRDFYDLALTDSFTRPQQDKPTRYVEAVKEPDAPQLALDLQPRNKLVLTPPEGTISGPNPLTPELAAELCAEIAFPRKRRFRWFTDWLQRMREYDNKKKT